MNLPLVSVIVPNYNYAGYLPLRIDSILKQSYVDFELILLDDASLDNSVAIFEKYKLEDSRVSNIIVNEQNSGSPFKQWKKGLMLAKGKYVWIAEGDDYADPMFLERTVAILEQHPKAAYCFTGSHIIDESGELLDLDMDKWMEQQLVNPLKFKLFPGEDYATRNMYWKNYVYNASGVLFRRTHALELKDQWVTMRYCGDWWFWSFMALKGDVIELYERLNYFRKHSHSVTLGSKLNEDAYFVCMMESMDVTWNLEKHLSFTTYKRWLCYGNYYKQFKRRKLDAVVKQKLFDKIRNQCRCVVFAYCLVKLNKLFSGLFSHLDRIKTERCI